MYKYIVKTVNELKLGTPFEETDELYANTLKSGLDFYTFFLLKTKEGESRQAFEKLNDFDVFIEYFPIIWISDVFCNLKMVEVYLAIFGTLAFCGILYYFF